jgi:hypothetical protein
MEKIWEIQGNIRLFFWRKWLAHFSTSASGSKRDIGNRMYIIKKGSMLI